MAHIVSAKKNDMAVDGNGQRRSPRPRRLLRIMCRRTVVELARTVAIANVSS